MLMDKECPTFGTNLSLITVSVSIRRCSRIQAQKAAAVGQVRQIAGQISLTIRELREIREVRSSCRGRRSEEFHFYYSIFNFVALYSQDSGTRRSVIVLLGHSIMISSLLIESQVQCLWGLQLFNHAKV